MMMAAQLLAIETQSGYRSTISGLFGGGYGKQTENARGWSNLVIHLEMKFEAVTDLIHMFFSNSHFVLHSARSGLRVTNT